MSDFKKELEKQVLYCCSMKNFRAAIFISSKDKIIEVKNNLKEIDGSISNVKTVFQVFNGYESYISFSNGSVLRIIVPPEKIEVINIMVVLLTKILPKR